jgi:hypothetical protein
MNVVEGDARCRQKVVDISHHILHHTPYITCQRIELKCEERRAWEYGRARSCCCAVFALQPGSLMHLRVRI